MKEVYVPKTELEKKMQRALLQYRLPKNKELVKEGYILAKFKGDSVENKKTPSNNKQNKSNIKKAGGFNKNGVYRAKLSSNTHKKHR